MVFYFIVHTLLGFCAGNCANIQMKSRQGFAGFPLWVYGPWGTIGAAVCVFTAFAAPVTTLFQWGIGWAVVTVGEVIVGAFVAGMLPMSLRLLLAVISPVVSVVIIGALWGLWYI